MKRLPLKICGLTRPEDALLCAEVGAAYAGFIFAPESPRRISPERAASLQTGAALRVGVFANALPEAVLDIMNLARLDYAQLHGGESVDVCRAVGPDRVIKVFWPQAGHGDDGAGGDAAVRHAAAAEKLRRDCELFAPVCALFLLDAGQGGGGSGQSLDFAALSDFRPPRPWLLAGGLGPHNLAMAAAACAPHAFDCNSELEQTPGRKDAVLVRRAAAVLRDNVSANCFNNHFLRKES